jgi:hypothetical protein
VRQRFVHVLAPAILHDRQTIKMSVHGHSSQSQSQRIGGISTAAASAIVETIGHRVMPAVAKRLAAQQPPAGQQAASPWTEAQHGNACIIRTAGIKAAPLSQQWTDPALVQTEQPQYQSSRGIHVAGTKYSV